MKKTNRQFRQNICGSQDGASLIELVIVMAVGVVLTTVALLSYASLNKYAADDQSLKILDVLQEARQRAINQKSVMRVEFNNTTSQIRLIDEKVGGVTADDAVIRTLPFNTQKVIVGTHPTNVSLTNLPQPDVTYGEIAFTNSNYVGSQNQNVFTLCFVKDGRVVQTVGNTCAAANSLRGATVYVYAPTTAGGKSEIVRALTISGTTGASSLYKCKMDADKNCQSWIN